MNRTVERHAYRAHRALHRRPTPARTPATLPAGRIARHWRPATTRPVPIRLAWNLPRTLAAGLWPHRADPARHRIAYTTWLAIALALALTSALLTLAALVATAAGWLVAQVAGVGLILTGWTPPTTYDPAALDPDRALFDDDAEHTPLPPAPRPAPPSPPAPLSVEERQLRLAERQTAALEHVARTPTPTQRPPAITWQTPAEPVRPLHHRLLIGAVALFLGVVAVIYLALWALALASAAGAIDPPLTPAQPTETTTTEVTP